MNPPSNSTSRPRPSMDDVNDGLIEGSIILQRTKCGHCRKPTRCIGVTKITLPEGLKPSKTLIGFKQDPSDDELDPVLFIGISCGCYAKFHRQIAHITSSRSFQNPRK